VPDPKVNKKATLKYVNEYMSTIWYREGREALPECEGLTRGVTFMQSRGVHTSVDTLATALFVAKTADGNAADAMADARPPTKNLLTP
jgi:hypothetical protein